MVERAGSAGRSFRTATASAMAAAALLAVGAAVGGSAFAGEGMVQVENGSDHPVKAVLPGARALVVAPGAAPVEMSGTTVDAGVGVTVRLWWTTDPRQLCQIYVPWGQTVTVTGSNEIRCLGR